MQPGTPQTETLKLLDHGEVDVFLSGSYFGAYHIGMLFNRRIQDQYDLCKRIGITSTSTHLRVRSGKMRNTLVRRHNFAAQLAKEGGFAVPQSLLRITVVRLTIRKISLRPVSACF